MTYSYNQHEYDKTYYKIYRAEWIVYGCSKLMLKGCISKKLILVCIWFDGQFNTSIEPLSNCILLEGVEFGIWFNQSMKALSYCKNLKCIALASHKKNSRSARALREKFPALNIIYY